MRDMTDEECNQQQRALLWTTPKRSITFNFRIIYFKINRKKFPDIKKWQPFDRAKFSKIFLFQIL